MNDGRLATAVLYIASKFMEIGNITPRDFYEKIAIANFGKYTMETEHQENIRTGKGNFGEDVNIDYTQIPKKQARKRLEESHSFLDADIEILRPDIIILPKTLHQIDSGYLNASSARIIEIYQMNAGVINRTISKKYSPVSVANLPLAVQRWYDELLKNGSSENYLYVFSYLNEQLKK